jgi:hypothetical protein
MLTWPGMELSPVSSVSHSSLGPVMAQGNCLGRDHAVLGRLRTPSQSSPLGVEHSDLSPTIRLYFSRPYVVQTPFGASLPAFLLVISQAQNILSP